MQTSYSRLPLYSEKRDQPFFLLGHNTSILVTILSQLELMLQIKRKQATGSPHLASKEE